MLKMKNFVLILTENNGWYYNACVGMNFYNNSNSSDLLKQGFMPSSEDIFGCPLFLSGGVIYGVSSCFYRESIDNASEIK